MTRRFAWFDCLRCAAIFLVILAHAGLFFGNWPGPAPAVLAALQNIGWVGVDLFFVLSGFLVSGLLFDEHNRSGRLDIRRFLIRRAFKIVPGFYALVLATAAYNLICHGRIVTTHLVHDLLFLQSYRAGAWPHAWTLAVEVHFYLLLALLLAVLSRQHRRDGAWLKPLPWIIGGILIASAALRGLTPLLLHQPFNFHRNFQPTHLHLDVLAAGVLLRYLYTYHPGSLAVFSRGGLAWALLGLALVLPSGQIWSHPSAFTVAFIPVADYLGFSLLLLQALRLPFPTSGISSRLVRPFDYFGKHSYSIYLWHLPVKEWIVDRLLARDNPAYFPVFVALSLAAGCLLSLALEMPVLHLRNRLFPSRAPALAIPPGPATVMEPAPEEALPEGRIRR